MGWPSSGVVAGLVPASSGAVPWGAVELLRPRGRPAGREAGIRRWVPVPLLLPDGDGAFSRGAGGDRNRSSRPPADVRRTASGRGPAAPQRREVPVCARLLRDGTSGVPQG